MSVATHERDPFGRMLGWSLVFHVLLVVSMALAASLRSTPSLLSSPVGEFMNISLGDSGPGAGLGGPGGGPVTPEPPPPEPEPEPQPEPEPAPREPTVVRPTVEQREELSMPDAPVQKPSRWEKPEQDSGLRGADAASAPSADLQASSGGGQAGPPGLGLGGAGGGSAFDQDFEYAYYVRQMLAKIHQHWQRTAVRGTAAVIVRFTILRDGTIQNTEIEQSSGVSILDRGALRAVILADPLPPLPNSYPRDQVGVHLRFTYSDQF